MLINNLGTCLVTGASGFVGARLVSYLKGFDINVKILGRRNFNNCIFNECDFFKDEIKEEFFEDVDTIFHLAGLAHDTDNKDSISNYEKINIETTKKITNIAIKNKVKRFIFLSSIKAVDLNNQDLQNLDSDIYGKTKRISEIYLQQISQSSGMSVKIIRSCLVYGPNMKGNLKDLFEAINQGWFPKLTKDTNKRSMIHVDDLVKALVLVAKEYSSTEPIVVSDGKGYSSREIYDSLHKKVNKKNFSLRLPEAILKSGYLIPVVKKKLQKIYGDEFFNTTEIFKLGFKPQFSLKEFNEKSF